MNKLLPNLSSLAEYRPLFRDAQVWLPALRVICARHGLDPRSLRIAPPGSNIVFWVEENLLIKLFAPLWPGDASKETAVLKALQDGCHFEVPRIRAEGEVEGWPYLVLTRLAGQPLDEIWAGLDLSAQEQLAASIGRLIASLQTLPISDLNDILPEWPGSWQEQIFACLARQRELGVSDEWTDQIEAFFMSILPVQNAPFRPVFLHSDLNPEHIFCQQTGEVWQVTGLIDFADAMIGHPFYEFAAPGYITRSSPALRRAMLQSAGYSPDQNDPTLSRTLLAFTLLHGYSSLPEMLKQFYPNPPSDLEELQSAFWAFG